jgi:hypothetical protein
MKKLVHLLLIVAYLAIPLCRADMIVLRDGREYSGNLLEGTETLVKFQVDDDIREFSRADVLTVHLQKQREWDDFNTVAELDDPILNRALELDLTPWQRRGAGTATLNHETVIHLRTSKTWEQRERQIVAVLNEHGESATIQQLRYLEDCEQAEIIHGVAITTDGRILHLRDTAVKLEGVYSEDARYDRMKQHRFALPEGKPGTILDVATVKTREKPRELEHFYGEFLFGTFDPVVERAVEIVVPEGTHLRWQVLNDPDGWVSMSEEKLANKQKRLRWERRDCPILLPEPNMPPLADVVPRLVVSAWPQEYDWKKLAREQAKILAEKANKKTWTRQSSAVDTRRVLPQGTAGSSLPQGTAGSSLEKLWYHIADTVSTTPVGVSATGWLPNDPGQTWNLRRGSQIDRTFLLFCELRKLGLNIQWGWYRSRGRGALADDVVALQAFDAPMLVVPILSVDPPVHGHFVVLGNELDNLQDPLDQLGGLSSLSPEPGVTRLPVPEAQNHAETHDIQLETDSSGNAEVSEDIVYTGLLARNIRGWRRSKQADLENRVRSIVREKFARAEEIEWDYIGDVGNDSERRQGIRLRYRVPELVDCRKTLAVARLPWIEFNGSVVSRENRQFAMEWSFPVDEAISISWNTPSGWKLLSEPEVFEDGVKGLAAVSAKLSQTDSGMRYSTEYLRRNLTVTPSEYAGFRELVQRRSRLGNLYWLFTRDPGQ